MAGMTCQNCGAKHGCGCKAKKAADGTNCCTLCVNKYNESLGKGPGPKVNSVNTSK